MRFIILAMTLFTSAAYGCGGTALSEEEVRAHPLISQWKTTFESSVGESLNLEEVKLAGSDILNIDMQATVQAMCSANYIFTYFRNVDSSVVCMLNLEGGPNGLIFLKNSLRKGKCRLANEEIINF